jgi:hypothetical protein
VLLREPAARLLLLEALPGRKSDAGSFLVCEHSTLKMEANLRLLMQMTTLAVRLTGRGWQLHDQRCQSPYLSSAIVPGTR